MSEKNVQKKSLETGTKPKTSQKSSSKTVPGSSDIQQNRNETFFENDAREDEFLKWFWEGSYGNNLVRKLNNYAQEQNLDDRIRREKESPAVYAVVVNAGDFPFKENGKQWKLCKVGFTHRSIKKGGSRMEKVCKQIKDQCSEGLGQHTTASTLFALRIGAVDTTSFSATEKRIREKVGKPVRKEKAKELCLPFPTEWVLTTQEHIDTIKEKKEEKMSDVDEGGDVIDFFKGIKNTPELPEEYEEWCTSN
ncbi:uncharacterized protein LOC116287082 [Actinia tenebrosa]|uniref:Uncharacterized protein LOC116287082 n=1 Tax=Actinia tenebrosa TaxID=6105 RepID=A0A6P8GZB0_ACTTE|nr:uncharacterized protein LOC116287082 [Actinia tenebrosa]